MGKLINVVGPGGKVVSVPAEEAARLEGRGDYRRETDQEEGHRALGSMNEARAEGFGQGVKAFAEGGLDALTGGGYGKVAGAISPDYAEDLANRGTYRPGARAAGELASFAVPVGLPAVAREAGEAVSAGLAARSINPLTRGAASLTEGAGRLAEGAILGAGGHVATTNVTGDPLTVEGTMMGMGVGGFLNVGLGAMADKFRKYGDKAKDAIGAAKTIKDDLDTVGKGRELFSNPPPSFEGFQSSAKKAADDAGKVFTAQKKAAKQYEEFLQPKRIEGAIRQAEKQRDALQAQLSKSKYSQAINETGEAMTGASEQLGKMAAKADKLTSSTEDWPSTMKAVDKAIKQVKNRPSYNTPGSTSNEAIHADLDAYSARASRIRKLRQGGYRPEGEEKWVADATVPPNPKQALEELHALRKDFTGRFGGQPFPDLPEIPKVEFPSAGARPAAGPAGQMDELRQLSQTSRALSDGINGVRAKFRTGDHEGAVEELRALKSKAQAAGRQDLVLPDVPEKIAYPGVEPEAIKIPKSLHEIANMSTERAQKISDLVASDPVAAQQFERLANDLGVNAVDGVAGLNAKLGSYIKADERLTALAKKKAEEETGSLAGILKDGAKKFVRYGSARVADKAVGGGFLGVGARIAAGEGSAAAMERFEDMISGSMMQSKLAATSAVSKLVSKFAAPTARVLKEIGPISAYLHNQILTGDKDDEKDFGTLAGNRVNEALKLSGAAPDAAYTAVQSVLGHPSDIAVKLSSKAAGDINYLVETAPKDPGIAMHGLKSDWKPSFEEALTYAYRIEAVVDPLKAIARTIAGDGHPAAVEALWNRWPALMQQAGEEFAYAVHDMKDMSYETASSFSLLFRTPITGLMTPEVAMAIQGAYLPKPQQQQGGSGGGTGNPVGRPAAVNNQVAGSSVSGLLSQTA